MKKSHFFSSCIQAAIGIGVLVWFVSLTAQQRVSAQGPSVGRYAYIVTATTTPVKAQSGFLLSVTINGGTAGVVTLYDIGVPGCTGTPGSGKFATIEAIGATNPTTLVYNLTVNNGVCVVTAAATDLTVTYN